MPIQRSIKRRRLDHDHDDIDNAARVRNGADQRGGLRSLVRSITPPGRDKNIDTGPRGEDGKSARDYEPLAASTRPAISVANAEDDTEDESDDEAKVAAEICSGSILATKEINGAILERPPASTKLPAPQSMNQIRNESRRIASPFQLTQIRDLPPDHNIDAISLHAILGHPLIHECWQFNYLHSIPFILDHFDLDVRPTVSLKVVHGFWRSDDPRKQRLYEQAEPYVNVRLIAAHMPEIFGTHHTKMMAIFRRDDIAQIVIHTANMIPQDWGNMTQAVWQSPELPVLKEEPSSAEAFQMKKEGQEKLGGGARFKADLLRYLRRYEGKTRDLVAQLDKYDFSAVRGALIASAPSKEALSSSKSATSTAWGWPGIKQILSQIPRSPASKTDPSKKTTTSPQINIQISSIATLTENWIQHFLSVLGAAPRTSSSATVTMTMLGGNRTRSKFNLIFPTPYEIRESLDGYDSGDSIHMKIDSKAQQKALSMLRPMLRHWDGSIKSPAPSASQDTEGRRLDSEAKGGILAEDEARGSEIDDKRGDRRRALRSRAAPHIKTYIRFSDAECKTMDWAILTSANLSTQAWGAMEDKEGKVRICSYELGMVVWPALYGESTDDEMIMVPAFGRDDVDEAVVEEVIDPSRKDGKANVGVGVGVGVVGLRMPYDLPLVAYGDGDEPWVATRSYKQLDWRGRSYDSKY